MNKGSFIVLIVIVAMLTVSVAMLAGYILIFRSGVETNMNVNNNNENVVKRPADDELGHKKLYNESQYFAVQNDNSSKTSILRIGIDLVYYTKGTGKKNYAEKLELFDSEIKELIGTYFQDKTLSQVKDIEFKKQAKEDLKRMINDLLNSNEKVYTEYIYEVVFYDWFYQ